MLPHIPLLASLPVAPPPIVSSPPSGISVSAIILLSFKWSDQVEDDGAVVRHGDRRRVFIVVTIVAAAAGAASFLYGEIVV